jgi:uncharacterized protein
LRGNGVGVTLLDELADFDTDDVSAVRKGCRAGSRFAQVTRAAAL